MIDPKKRVLIVYNFKDEDVTPEIMPLEGDYPMNIYDGKLRIDLEEVNQIIERFSK